jgi:beta-glucosidase-like glycosyl hydrolase/CubicO group peptidase (beta-lactamase class C family)
MSFLLQYSKRNTTIFTWRMTWLPCAVCVAAWLCGFSAAAQRRSYLEILNSHNAWTDSIMQTLSVREKAAQLLMIAVYSTKDGANSAATAKLITEHKVGGLIFFQGSPAAQAELTNYYQSISRIPLLIGMDAEWGVGMRLDSVPRLPYQIVLGAAQNPKLSYEMGSEIARQFALLGMHINFAPVADINNNPENPVINVRSAGENRSIVAQNIAALTQGMQDGGILACAKHFPGHGNTNVDSHYDVPTLHTSRRSINRTEFYPFKYLIEKGVAAVMVGHLRSQALDTTMEIASMSPTIITNVLKQELKFNGLVISDGMQMKAVSAQRSNAPQANLYALMAGNDILVFPKDIAATLDTIERAVENSRFPQELLDLHCRRVLNTKYYFKLNTGAPYISSVNLLKKLNTTNLHSIKTRIAEEAMLLLHDPRNSIPLAGIDTARIAFLEADDGQGKVFLETIRRYTNVKHFKIKQTNVKTYLPLLDSLTNYDYVIVGYFDIMQRQPQTHYNMNAAFCQFLLQAAGRVPVVMALFASPYTAARLLDLRPYRAILIAHDSDAEYQKAAAEAIFGAVPIMGKSPVSVPPQITQGQGIERRGVTRLKHGSPQDVGISPARLTKIDTILLNSIKEKIFPGCQVLAAHNSVIFYNKTFGHHTYEQKMPVMPTDLYDVASLTKVLATLPLVMKLYDYKALRLDDRLGALLPEIPDDKKNILISELLMHQSGLKAWLPLHVRYLISTDPQTAVLSAVRDDRHPIYVYSQTYLNINHNFDTAFFSDKPSPQYTLPVARNIWAKAAIRQDIYRHIDTSAMMEKTYRYSDLGFYYLQRVVERIMRAENGMDSELERLFYKPLGMKRTTFLPLTKFNLNTIIPTEHEPVFRRQLIHGYVHDHGAAVMGGVAGHAGLFSTAEDIAVFLQMLLWRGKYGGRQFLLPATIDKFTQYQSADSRRGLGFDKPERKPPVGVVRGLSAKSYGHTGFTGCMVWVDPERDLVFVFLSNRLHPDYNNNLITQRLTRTNVLLEFIWAVDAKRRK